MTEVREVIIIGGGSASRIMLNNGRDPQYVGEPRFLTGDNFSRVETFFAI